MDERSLRIVYNYDYSSNEELLNTDSSFSIHQKNLQFFATEMFRVYTGSAPHIFNAVFPLTPESLYSLKNQQTFATSLVHTIHYGPNSLRYLMGNGSK